MSLSQKRSEVGNAAKRYKSKPDAQRRRALDEARRDLAAAKLEAYIQRVVDEAPELSVDQRSRLALLLKAEHR